MKFVTCQFERFEARCVLSAVSFVEQPDITGHDAVGLVHAADLDMDGDTDILSASEGQLVWYRNVDGNGTMSPPIELFDSAASTQGLGTSVISADFDGDGDNDVLWSYFNHLVWFENVNGGGTFSDQRTIRDDPTILSSVSLADLDDDGDIDVAATYVDEDKVVWFENSNGLGDFELRHVIPNNLEYAHTVFATDVNQDGRTDLVVSDIHGKRVVWFNNIGNGVFVQSDKEASVDGAAAVYGADVDRDGDTDIVVAGHQTLRSGKLFWLENTDGLGSFNSQHLIADVAGPIAMRDIDADGDDDIALGSGSFGRTVSWYENVDGAGNFEQRSVYGGSHYVRSIDLADVDSDGHVDVLATSKDEGTVSWFSNSIGDGTFSPQRKLAARAQNVESIAVADLDGDGDDDVVSAAVIDREVAWYQNEGLGIFRIEEIISATESGPESVFVIDVDGDGDNDVLSASSNDESIRWHENIDGQGTFDQQPLALPALEAEVVSAADLDGDGDADLLAASSEDDVVMWFQNLDSKGSFGQPTVISSDRSYRDVETADLDADGDVDILVIAKHSVSWFENTDGQFGVRQEISSQVRNGIDVKAADLDGDGDLDVIGGAEGEYSRERGVAWFENLDGRGTFGPKRPIADVGEFIHAADFDADGDLDLVSAGNRTAHFHENINGAGSFAKPQLITDRLLSASSINASDVDRDDDIDILISDRHRGKITWYENRPPGDINDDGQFDSADLVLAFAAGEYEDLLPGNSSYKEGDWDGDGDFRTTDLVFAFQSGLYTRAAKPREAIQNDIAPYQRDDHERSWRPFRQRTGSNATGRGGVSVEKNAVKFPMVPSCRKLPVRLA